MLVVKFQEISAVGFEYKTFQIKMTLQLSCLIDKLIIVYNSNNAKKIID